MLQLTVGMKSAALAERTAGDLGAPLVPGRLDAPAPHQRSS